MSFTFRKFNINSVVALLQAALLVFYLFINIEGIGDAGSGLHFLILFMGVSSFLVFYKCMKTGLRVKIHLFFLFVFVWWVALRHLVDYGGIDVLKQVTIATTGGIFLFYMVGFFIRECLSSKDIDFRVLFLIFGFLYLIILSWVLIQLLSRVRTDLFLLSDLDGDYQRPGNFISISFILLSFMYVKSSAVSKFKNGRVGLISVVIYLCSVGMLLMLSQLIGSNSATVVVSVLAFVSIFIVLLVSSKYFFDKYIIKGGRIFKLKNIISVGFVGFFIIAFLLFILSMLFIWYYEPDLTQTRLFSEDGGSSLSSRREILSLWGLKQISYAPFLGNVNVAYLVTGDAGITLHNLFPNIFASLGIVGLLVFLIMLFIILRSTYRSSTKVFDVLSVDGFVDNITSFYSLIVLLFLIFLSNFSVGYTWPVIWFSIGFLATSMRASKCIRIKRFPKNSVMPPAIHC